MAANSRPIVKTLVGWPAIALAATLSAFVASLLADFGTVIDYVTAPLVATLAVWIVVGVVRLCVVGFLRTEDDDLIPPVFDRWFDGWFALRRGLSGALLLLWVAFIASAVSGGPVRICFEALVYLAFLYIVLNLGFGTALNIGILSRRRQRARRFAD